MAHLPWYPVGPQACSCSDLPEVAQDAVTIKGRADRRSEDKVVILPERSCVQPVGRLLFAMLAESLDRQVGQQQDASALPQPPDWRLAGKPGGRRWVRTTGFSLVRRVLYH